MSNLSRCSNTRFLLILITAPEAFTCFTDWYTQTHIRRANKQRETLKTKQLSKRQTNRKTTVEWRRTERGQPSMASPPPLSSSSTKPNRIWQHL